MTCTHVVLKISRIEESIGRANSEIRVRVASQKDARVNSAEQTGYEYLGANAERCIVSGDPAMGGRTLVVTLVSGGELKGQIGPA